MPTCVLLKHLKTLKVPKCFSLKPFNLALVDPSNRATRDPPRCVKCGASKESANLTGKMEAMTASKPALPGLSRRVLEREAPSSARSGTHQNHQPFKTWAAGYLKPKFWGIDESLSFSRIFIGSDVLKISLSHPAPRKQRSSPCLSFTFIDSLVEAGPSYLALEVRQRRWWLCRLCWRRLWSCHWWHGLRRSHGRNGL